MVEAQVGYKKELYETAHAIVRPGYGLLAADESTNTIGAKFEKHAI